MILLIDNYDSFTYNLVHYFGDLGVECRVVRNDQITVDEALGSRPQAIVLSPGPCDPDQAGVCLDLIRANQEARVPLLGVCLGHQAIGQAYGGRVIRAPKMMHGKLSTIRNEGVGLFAGLPREFEATRYHSLIVEAETLPPALNATAHTADGLIMALQHETDPVYGVQFHPESIASNFGHAILANFLTLARVNWRAAKPGLALPQLASGAAA
ncbi:MAG: aminodeoxychorismate/anthranilate synthase component II [Hyphomicrobiales bacterium]|nr:aminodeoxychorismate/anthranilate synthase component II [Hyphomicrobiales bacterium]